MKTTKLFLMAALALTFAACSNDNYDAAQPAKGEGITITATLAPKSDGAATRAVAEGTNKITVTWAVDEQIAILYEVNNEKKVAAATISSVDGSGAATISFSVADGTPNDTPCTLVYPASTAKDDNMGVKDAATLLAAQNGTLNANLDVRVGEGTIQTTTPGLTVTTQPEAQYSIFKFTTQNGSADINVSALTVTIGEQAYVITPSSATSELYAALPAVSGQKVRFSATGSDSKTYAFSKNNVSFTKGKFYQSTLKMADIGQAPAGCELVDLGLSVKWANLNVGATSESDYGDYFAWGETEPYYSSQDPLTWKTGKSNGYADDWSSYKFGSLGSFIKYSSSDNKMMLDLEDDAAAVNWGSSWRMPTYTELKELCDTKSNTTDYTWDWITVDGHYGWKITSKKSGTLGNSIFLPAAGQCRGTSLENQGSGGRYWSSTNAGSNMSKVWSLYFNTACMDSDSRRYSGFTVRPVQAVEP